MSKYVNPPRITKKELRIRLGLTKQGLAKVLNIYHFDQLIKTGYQKHQKYLLRHQLDIIFPAGIEFENE